MWNTWQKIGEGENGKTENKVQSKGMVDASVFLENNQWHIFHPHYSEDIDDII